jgi:hypothetical protein
VRGAFSGEGSLLTPLAAASRPSPCERGKVEKK